MYFCNFRTIQHFFLTNFQKVYFQNLPHIFIHIFLKIASSVFFYSFFNLNKVFVFKRFKTHSSKVSKIEEPLKSWFSDLTAKFNRMLGTVFSFRKPSIKLFVKWECCFSKFHQICGFIILHPLLRIIDFY